MKSEEIVVNDKLNLQEKIADDLIDCSSDDTNVSRGSNGTSSPFPEKSQISNDQENMVD